MEKTDETHTPTTLAEKKPMFRRTSRKVTPPSPTYMTGDEFATYLSDLRKNRVTRPGGARPLPASTFRSQTRSSAIADPRSEQPQVTSGDISPKTASPAAAAPLTTQSSVSRRLRGLTTRHSITPLKPSEVVPTTTYIERGQRWMEKKEAASLRQALEHMDLKSSGASVVNRDAADEDTIYEQAQEEASELIRDHKEGYLPRAKAPYRYRSHLRKNSYARARAESAGMHDVGFDLEKTMVKTPPKSSSTSETDTNGDQYSTVPSYPPARPETTSMKIWKAPLQENATGDNTSGGSAILKGPDGISRRKNSLKRNISGELDRPFSGDQIWQDSGASYRGSQQTGGDQENEIAFGPRQVNVAITLNEADQSFKPKPRVSTTDIHRNPPSQSHNPLYRTNELSSTPPSSVNEDFQKKHGMEIRADDIREATSIRLRDRSIKLPTPTAVSNDPGRPIVSFDRDWNASDDDKSKEGCHDGTSHSYARFAPTSREAGDIYNDTPEIEVTPVTTSVGTQYPIPCILIEDDKTVVAPVIPPVPSIVVNETPSNEQPIVSTYIKAGTEIPSSRAIPGSSRPLPVPKPGVTPQRRFQRPLPTESGLRKPNASGCHECGNHIQGRFVALAGAPERFHPGCIACFVCGTSLEALEISQEPDSFRKERLNRLRRRASGEILDEEPGKTMAEDGDERLRFYCHLDWHELFAPRCKHCKTPILGEHVFALGAHWHRGHFFCAECGDPFSDGMTHIEKDGYAWCVKCQTRMTERRAPKCKRCKVAVIGQYIVALGGEWHDQCFRCTICQGTFDDGQIFPRENKDGMVVLCTQCRAGELKS